MMGKDERYRAVKRMIDAGDITRLDQCFKIIPKTVVATDMKEHQGRFSTRMSNIVDVKMSEVFELANLFEVDIEAIVRLLANQYAADQKKSQSSRNNSNGKV